jgi:hypothetical protein
VAGGDHLGIRGWTLKHFRCDGMLEVNRCRGLPQRLVRPVRPEPKTPKFSRLLGVTSRVAQRVRPHIFGR